MGKIDPERHRQIIEEGRAARAHIQEILDRVEIKLRHWREWEERREHRRRLLRRLLTLGLKA